MMVIIALSSDARAINESFSYDIDEVNTQLAPLTKLEQLHINYPDKTFQELITDNELAGYSFAAVSNSQSGFYEPMPILPAFWWGCILGWVGILVVFLVTQDSLQTKSALWGCIVGSLLGCFIYVILIVSTGFTPDLFYWFW